ncbi:MAG: hypothetical protein KJO88_09135 [Gammaproteobacteria bacterium]|nr:hypothetical protein [Gammaproteobacteria bacterium]NNM13678.1 hypothetical protein [Gammaproteobacteria bacterium]
MKSNSVILFIALTFTILFTHCIHADVVVLDDQIIDGSQCVGLDCADGEDFGFDTLKLKTSDPVLSFVDTSTSAMFPTVDWSMGILDSATETSYFFIKDVTSDVDVLKMSASSIGGIAIGAGSELIDNVISVGATGTERIISHVADGLDPNDAVTKGQFDAFTATVPNLDTTLSDFNAQLITLESDLAALSLRLDDVMMRLDNLP